MKFVPETKEQYLKRLMKIDLTKPVQTRDGRPVRIVCTDAPGSCPVVGFCTELSPGQKYTAPETWTAEGAYLPGCEDDYRDLINVPKKIERWHNIYDDGSSNVFLTRDDADADDESSSDFKRVACILVSVTEGEGL